MSKKKGHPTGMAPFSRLISNAMKVLVGLTFILITFMGFAQDKPAVTLTLDQCIKTALENNIQLKQAKNNELIAKSNSVQSLMQMLPSVNADINYDFSSGNTFDQNTGQVVNTTTSRSNPNISANWILFQGLSNFNTRRQREQQLISSTENVENTKLTTEANILSSYLNVVISQENIKVALQRVDLLTAQLDREIKRESVGVGNLESVYNFRSQLANEKLNLANLQNGFERNKLILLQSMQLDPTAAEYQVEPYPASEEELLIEPDAFGVVLNDALNTNPGIKSALAQRQAAKFGYRAAQGRRLPTVSALGVYGSNYSTNGAFNPTTDQFESDATFFDQMDFNQFEYLNFSLSLPLFSRFQNHNAIQVAKLNMANAELDTQQANLTATNTVQTVYLDLIAAQNTYRSASENLVALQQSFEFMEKRYQTGNSDFYTYLESLNNKNRAEVQLVNAKYSIVLRRKILDLYRGSSTD